MRHYKENWYYFIDTNVNYVVAGVNEGDNTIIIDSDEQHLLSNSRTRQKIWKLNLIYLWILKIYRILKKIKKIHWLA